MTRSKKDPGQPPRAEKQKQVPAQKPDDVIRSLHPHEKKILAALRQLGQGTPAQLAEQTGLPEASVHKAGLWARVKGLLRHEEAVSEQAALTEEGRRYGREGLPEKRLLQLVSSGTNTVPELKKKLDSLDIALGWAKRKGWITIAAGALSLTPDGKQALRAQTAVERALRAGELTAETAGELKARKLASTREQATKTYRLTDAGARLAQLLPPETVSGGDAGQLTPDDLRTGAWQKKAYRPYDLTTPVPALAAGRLHPYVSYLQRIRERLVAQGFQEARGPWVETEFWNADALFMPQDHPARGLHDVFFLRSPARGEVRDPTALALVGKTHRNGWATGSRGWGAFDPGRSKNLILRSQTTAVTARVLASRPAHAKWFCIGRAFRPDVLDATHAAEFYQCDCIVIGEKLNLRHLAAYLTTFAQEIAGAADIRLRPSYFPFVEPGVEVDAKINGKWIEVAGAGIFRPEVTKPLGEERSVLAWAFGLDRLAMRALGVPDIRQFSQPDLGWLRSAKAVV